MPIFDPAKNLANRRKHGIALADFRTFDSEPAIVVDDRRDYGEVRLQAFGRIGGVGFCLVFTPRGDDIRLISLRRAHASEMAYHDR